MEEVEAIQQAANIIKSGGVVAFPTETVYGLGADAFNPIAVARIFEIKNRPSFDPLIVHIADLNEMSRLVIDIPHFAAKLIKRFWPGPLTIVFFKKEEVPDIVTAGLPTVAIRMPRHPIALQLIKKANRPIAAPSANPFGYVSPTTAEHVREQLGDRVDLILDGGPCEVGLESTILSFSGGETQVTEARRAPTRGNCVGHWMGGYKSDRGGETLFSRQTSQTLCTQDAYCHRGMAGKSRSLSEQEDGIACLSGGQCFFPVSPCRSIISERRLPRGSGKPVRSDPSPGCSQPGSDPGRARSGSGAGSGHSGPPPSCQRERVNADDEPRFLVS